MTHTGQAPAQPEAEETLLVELNIPSDMDLVSMVVDLGTSMITLKGFGTDDIAAVRFAIHVS